MRKVVKIGLTGGIATGKSTVSRLLEKIGAVRVDTDALGWESYDPQISPQQFQQVLQVFSPEVLGTNGKVDRRILGTKVFRDPTLMKRLCDISWPRIMELFQQRIDRLVAEDPENPNPLFVVMEAAILIEAGWVGGVDEVWVVVTDPEVACQRLMARNSLSRDEALRRIGAQMSNEEKAKYARVVIHNDANLPTVEAAMALLESQVRAEWDALLDRTK